MRTLILLLIIGYSFADDHIQLLNTIANDIKAIKSYSKDGDKDIIMKTVDQRWVDYVKLDKQLGPVIFDGKPGQNEERIKARTEINSVIIELDNVAFDKIHQLSFTDVKGLNKYIPVLKSHRKQYENIEFEMGSLDESLNQKLIKIIGLIKYFP